MAFALARSFRLWHGDSDISFHLVTDARTADPPADLRDLNIIPITAGQYGSGFYTKLHLDVLAPSDCSMFIDADCLCVGPIDDAFKTFRGRPVSVIGTMVHDVEWFGDIATICRQYNIPAMPKFNGGLYYLERGSACAEVFETARRLAERYDELGFVRLRGQPNDEVLISLAMAIHGQTPIPERDNIMNTIIDGPCGIELDVMKGYARIPNPKNHPKRNPWHEGEILRPKIVHFLGIDTDFYPYNREILRLERRFRDGWPQWLVNLYATISVSIPALLTNALKDALRPMYHALIGVRPVRANRRVVN
jgi:hypothetical protein